MIDHLRQNRMSKPREDPRFPFKCRTERIIISEKCTFQSDGAPQPLINGQIDVTHPAFSDRLYDQIAVLDHGVWG